MERHELEELLRGILVKNSRVTVDGIEEGQVLARDVGLDSLALVRSLAELEEALRITFPVERLDDPGELTFGELVRLVAETLAA